MDRNRDSRQQDRTTLGCIGDEDLRRDLIARSWHLDFSSKELNIFGFKVLRFWKFVEVGNQRQIVYSCGSGINRVEIKTLRVGIAKEFPGVHCGERY